MHFIFILCTMSNKEKKFMKYQTLQVLEAAQKTNYKSEN